MTRPSGPYLRGQRIDPDRHHRRARHVADLVDNAFLAYNAGRLREGVPALHPADAASPT